MKVLHVVAGNLFGGVENLLLTLESQKRVCPQMEPYFASCFEGRFSEGINSLGGKIFIIGTVRVSRPWSIYSARRRLREFVASENFDIIVCHGCWPQAIFGPVIKLMHKPLVFWCHDAPSGKHWLERWSAKIYPDLIIANSNYTLSKLLSLYPGMKGDVVYSPVAFNILSDQRLLKGNIRRELNTKEDAVVIIQASRMEPWKGHGILLLALSRLNDLSNWICWIAGGAQRPKELAYMNSLKKEAKRLGISDRVIFLGYRHDIPNLLCASDIFCQPNIRPEPFGISFIEALYANLPVVTSSVGGALEIINRSCGILVKPNDYNALSLSLRRLITDQAQRLELGGIGYTRANDLCNPDKQINKIYNLLSSLKR